MKQKLLMMLAALMLMGTSAMAQSETLKGDVNGDSAVDVADIAAVIQIMKDNGDIETKYYWYEGWTKPTSSNIATLVSNADGVSSRGAVVTSLDATELVKSTETIRNSSKANIYVVIPTGYKIYDITLNIDVTNTSFTEVTDELIPNHKVYTFNDPTRISTSIYIRK